jgi:hypothetical protein
MWRDRTGPGGSDRDSPGELYAPDMPSLRGGVARPRFDLQTCQSRGGTAGKWARSTWAQRATRIDGARQVILFAVIVHNNEEHHIGSCLESISAQIGPTDREVIVVDDGFVGSTTDVVRERQTHDDSVRLISQKNVACGPARSAGVTAAMAIPSPWSTRHLWCRHGQIPLSAKRNPKSWLRRVR